MRAEISFGADRAAVDRVTRQLAGVGRLGVAFSGGVDSATLLALAVRALGAGQVVALLGVSPSLAADERAAAHDVARSVGVPVVEVETREGDRPGYRANGPDRCFHCKDELFTTIGAEVLDRHGLDRIAYGENADDVRRPGPARRAGGDRHRVLRPLADAGLDKAAVRASRGCSAALRRQAGGTCLARDPAPRAGDAGELPRSRRRERALRALGSPTAACATTATSPASNCRSGRSPAPSPTCATMSTARSSPPASDSWRSTSPGSSPVRSPSCS